MVKLYIKELLADLRKTCFWRLGAAYSSSGSCSPCQLSFPSVRSVLPPAHDTLMGLLPCLMWLMAAPTLFNATLRAVTHGTVALMLF